MIRKVLPPHLPQKITMALRLGFPLLQWQLWDMVWQPELEHFIATLSDMKAAGKVTSERRAIGTYWSLA